MPADIPRTWEDEAWDAAAAEAIRKAGDDGYCTLATPDAISARARVAVPAAALRTLIAEERRLRERVAALEGDNERLTNLLNSPELHSFRDGVLLEAMHQRERWGDEHAAGKAPADWFWLVGYLAGKALHAHVEGRTDKALHHTITPSAAAPPSEIAALLDAIYQWMRRPDHDERFSLADLIEWVNARPVAELLALRARAAALEAEQAQVVATFVRGFGLGEIDMRGAALLVELYGERTESIAGSVAMLDALAGVLAARDGAEGESEHG